MTSTTGSSTCPITEMTNDDSAITVALGAVIGVLVVLQIITLISYGVVARRKNTNYNDQVCVTQLSPNNSIISLLFIVC